MPTFSWTPTASQIAPMMVARVPGGFTDDTIPTADAIEAIAAQVAVEVVGRTSTFDPAVITNPAAAEAEQTTLGDLAKWACILGASAYAESAFYPEQQYQQADTPASQLNARFNTAVSRLVDAIQRDRQQDRFFGMFIGRNRIRDDRRWQEIQDEYSAYADELAAES